MKFWFLLLPHIFFTITFTGCSPPKERVLQTQKDGNEYLVVIQKIKNGSEVNSPGTVVYGNITITGARKIASANLSCASLRSNGNQSSKPYVNSIASVATENYLADSSGIIRAKLYWLFPEILLTSSNINDLSLVIENEKTPCVTQESILSK